jgi:hypothetical protein
MFGAGMMFGAVTSTGEGGYYVVSSSEKIATHPTIVRAASVASSEEVAVHPVIAGAVFVTPHRWLEYHSLRLGLLTSLIIGSPTFLEVCELRVGSRKMSDQTAYPAAAVWWFERP